MKNNLKKAHKWLKIITHVFVIVACSMFILSMYFVFKGNSQTSYFKQNDLEANK